MKVSVCRTILGAAVSTIGFCWSGPIHAEETENIWGSILAITANTGISVDEIAAYLTLGRTSEQAEPTLVRWNQAEITLGLVVSSDAPAPLVEAVAVGIQRQFDLVNKKLAICVRSWPGGSEIPDQGAAPIGDCRSGPTEIDVVVDALDSKLLKEIEALPSDATQHYLRDTWSRIRREVLAQPELHFCNVGFSTDATAHRLVGGAGIVWVPPTGEKKALELAEKCSLQLGYWLLGSFPILDEPGGDSGTLSPDLLALLYSDQFKSGQSRSEVLATLREAQP